MHSGKIYMMDAANCILSSNSASKNDKAAALCILSDPLMSLMTLDDSKGSSEILEIKDVLTNNQNCAEESLETLLKLKIGSLSVDVFDQRALRKAAKKYIEKKGKSSLSYNLNKVCKKTPIPELKSYLENCPREIRDQRVLLSKQLLYDIKEKFNTKGNPSLSTNKSAFKSKDVSFLVNKNTSTPLLKIDFSSLPLIESKKRSFLKKFNFSNKKSKHDALFSNKDLDFQDANKDNFSLKDLLVKKESKSKINKNDKLTNNIDSNSFKKKDLKLDKNNKNEQSVISSFFNTSYDFLLSIFSSIFLLLEKGVDFLYYIFSIVFDAFEAFFNSIFG